MRKWLWAGLFSLIFALPQQASAGCSATASSCPCSVSCTGQTTCTAGTNYVECDGNRTYCQPPCSIACPNEPSVNCSGCYCYYWQHLFGNTDAIACTDSYVPMGGSYGYPFSQSCPGGEYTW